MRFEDAQATNLFARLFTYVSRPIGEVEQGKKGRRRNALEDFCTEALAWCLLQSEPFAKALLASPAFRAADMPADGLQIDTQLSFKPTADESDPRRVDTGGGRFDLVLRSPTTDGTLVVIEVKVAPDRPEAIANQIDLYRQHVTKGEWRSYRHKWIVLLTPYSEKHGADAHLSWSQVRDVLEVITKAQRRLENSALKEFLGFLNNRNLAKMKLPPINDSLAAFRQAGPLLAGLQTVFDAVRNDEVCRALFRRSDSLPKMDWNEKDKRLWYGIWSRGSPPHYYVGFETSASSTREPLLMWVQVSVAGNRKAERLPETLSYFFNKKLSGLEGDSTAFVFTKAIASADESSAAIEGWFVQRLRDVKQWAEGLK